ncbi:MAG: hypothetical protein MdMp014T_1123 [Treponematales bacterium]
MAVFYGSAAGLYFAPYGEWLFYPRKSVGRGVGIRAATRGKREFFMKRFYVKENEGEEFEKARKGKGGFALVRGFGKSGRSGAVLAFAGLFIMTMALVFAACGAAEAGGGGRPPLRRPTRRRAMSPSARR